MDVSVALVPTMGALHDGHLSLVKLARATVGDSGIVVVSIYVNPTQFGPNEDFDKYPRDFDSDCEKCREQGVDVIFAPTDSEMYPGRSIGRYSTYVIEQDLGSPMEGRSRPTHFQGVTTVVAKLFLACLPDISIFGQKDFQQVAVIKRMVKDLNFSVQVIVCPTYREPDGLAMSSRNKYLTPTQRTQATVLFQILNEISKRVSSSKSEGRGILQDDLTRIALSFIRETPEAELDYICGFDPETLQTVKLLDSGHQIAIAVFFGDVRLIDNVSIG